MKLLLCGDSFSYDHGIDHSWPTRLSRVYQFDNNLIELYNTWNANCGDINHLNISGHYEFFNQISSLLV